MNGPTHKWMDPPIEILAKMQDTRQINARFDGRRQSSITSNTISAYFASSKNQIILSSMHVNIIINEIDAACPMY